MKSTTVLVLGAVVIGGGVILYLVWKNSQAGALNVNGGGVFGNINLTPVVTAASSLLSSGVSSLTNSLAGDGSDDD